MKSLKISKIFIKALGLTFAFALLCASLSGCFLVDTLEKQQGFFIEDNKIEYNGKVYRLLPKTESVSVYYGNSTVIYVTDSDVPVLLSQTYGVPYLLSDDGVFLEEDAQYKEGIYCEESRYEEFANRIYEGITPNEYCVETADGLRLLTEAEAQMLENTVVRENLRYFKNDEPYMYDNRIYTCTEDAVFIDEEYRICEYDEKYYIAYKTFFSGDLYEWAYYAVSKVDYSILEDMI